MTEDKEQEKTKNSEILEEPNAEDQNREERIENEFSEASEDGEAQEEKSAVEKLKEEIQESKDKYLRLYSEFENYRRRTAKERLDLIKTANQDLITALLPVMDDFERAQKALEESKDHKASKEGFDLIYNKFSNILKQKGLKPMDDKEGSEFNTEFHEAITQIPVEKKKLKGKIIDVIEKGYYLDDKVVRFAKVVLGA